MLDRTFAQGWNGLLLNTYTRISLYARTNRRYNERGSRTSYVRSSIPHRTCKMWGNIIIFNRTVLLPGISDMTSLSRLDRHDVSQSVGQYTNLSTSDLRRETQLASQVTQACRRGSKSLRCPAAVPTTRSTAPAPLMRQP